MRPWLTNPEKLIKAARKYRALVRHQNACLVDPELPWKGEQYATAQQKFFDAVDKYEKAIYRGGPKQKAK